MRIIAAIVMSLLLAACATPMPPGRVDVPSQVPPGIAAGLATIGRVVAPPQTAALYVPVSEREPYAGVVVRRDVPYGADARHLLDVFAPHGGQGARPVLVFVHGGAFVGGSKQEDETYHRNVGEYFARNGFLTLITNYRLAPAHPWPAGAQDLGRVLAWAQDNVAQWGGLSSCIQVLGQSAGASHVASWIFDEQVRASHAVILRGAALMSGVYRLVPTLPPPLQSYWGADPSIYPSRAPITHVKSGHPPLLLTVTEFDPGWLARDTFDLALALTVANGQSPRFAWLAGHNHVSTGISLGSPQDDLGQILLSFLRSNL